MIFELEKEQSIYIAGAHSRARTLKAYLNYLYPNIKVEAFLVDDLSENPEEADGIPVWLIAEGLDVKCSVYLGTRGVNHPKLTNELSAVGFTQIIPVTVELDMKLRNEYVRRFYRESGKTFLLIDNVLPKDSNKGVVDAEGKQHTLKGGKTAKIYVANSIFDRKLKKEYNLVEDEKVLQVGAALTDRRIYEGVITDCEGDNISNRNQQFCELTGLYWIWKHAREDYVGLVHYRRHFILPWDWVQRMTDNDLDVILPVPLYVAPSLAENYKSRHIASDWNFLMEYFRDYLPDEYELVRAFFDGNLYSPCNMLIARREALERLCSWLFPILDAVVEHGGEKEDSYMNRYPGFISERLITYFFEGRGTGYRVVYANKNFLV